MAYECEQSLESRKWDFFASLQESSDSSVAGLVILTAVDDPPVSDIIVLEKVE